MTVELPRNKNGHIVPRSFKLPFAPLEAQMKARGMSIMDMMEALGSDIREKVSEYRSSDEYKTIIQDKTQRNIAEGMTYTQARRSAIHSTKIPVVENQARSTWRYHRDGINTYHADHWAVALGLHPAQIWTEWYDIPDEVFIQQDPTAMELRKEIRKAKQNHRDRINYDKRNDTERRRLLRGQMSREEYTAKRRAEAAAKLEEEMKSAYKVTSNGKGGFRTYTKEQWEKRLADGRRTDKLYRERKAAERAAAKALEPAPVYAHVVRNKAGEVTQTFTEEQWKKKLAKDARWRAKRRSTQQSTAD